MPNKPYENISKDKQNKMLKLSIKEFLLNPYNSITVSSLTDTMRILRTDFYYYFKDKDDIYETILKCAVEMGSIDGVFSIENLVNKMYDVLVKLEGPRNIKYINEISTNFSPDAIDYFIQAVEYVAKNTVSVEDFIQSKQKAFSMFAVLKEYSLGKITAEEGKKLLK